MVIETEINKFKIQISCLITTEIMIANLIQFMKDKCENYR